jgi:hypothetical protein
MIINKNYKSYKKYHIKHSNQIGLRIRISFFHLIFFFISKLLIEILIAITMLILKLNR